MPKPAPPRPPANAAVPVAPAHTPPEWTMSDDEIVNEVMSEASEPEALVLVNGAIHVGQTKQRAARERAARRAASESAVYSPVEADAKPASGGALDGEAPRVVTLVKDYKNAEAAKAKEEAKEEAEPGELTPATPLPPPLPQGEPSPPPPPPPPPRETPPIQPAPSKEPPPPLPRPAPAAGAAVRGRSFSKVTAVRPPAPPPRQPRPGEFGVTPLSYKANRARQVARMAGGPTLGPPPASAPAPMEDERIVRQRRAEFMDELLQQWPVLDATFEERTAEPLITHYNMRLDNLERRVSLQRVDGVLREIHPLPPRTNCLFDNRPRLKPRQRLDMDAFMRLAQREWDLETRNGPNSTAPQRGSLTPRLSEEFASDGSSRPYCST